MKQFISNSIKDTEKIAEELSQSFSDGDIILLDGDLGAGKTAFVKAVVKAYKGNSSLVTSPTFTLVNEYRLEDKTIYHFDLYRIESVDELYNIGIEEYFYSGAICFIEWPERASELFIGKRKKVTIEKLSETSRKFTYEEIL